jgi:hypothetical protein
MAEACAAIGSRSACWQQRILSPLGREPAGDRRIPDHASCAPAASPPHRKGAAGFVDELVYLATGADVAKHAGTLRYDALRRGVTLAIADTLIAATALAYGPALLPGNVRHYPFPDLPLVALPGRPTHGRDTSQP